MREIDWKDRQAGDVGVVRYPGLLGNAIAKFELDMHPEYKDAFIPSHAFIIGNGDTAIEASLTRSENSVAAMNAATEYDNLPVRLFRIQRLPAQVAFALTDFILEYANEGYGLLNLLGFAIEAVARKLGNLHASNPVLLSYVCSQGVLIFLRYPSLEKWPLAIELHDCDPLFLLMNCLLNEAKP